MTGKFKILIVDDEEMMTDLFEVILETEFDCEIVKVNNGELAIEALKNTNDFSLIISDFNMPGSNGGKVHNFNRHHLNIPFFLFSGGEIKDCPEFNDFENANELNCFFYKPFATQEFLAAVRQVKGNK